MVRIILICLFLLPCFLYSEYANNQIIVKVKNSSSLNTSSAKNIPSTIIKHTEKLKGNIRNLKKINKINLSSIQNSENNNSAIKNTYIITLPTTVNIEEIIKSYLSLPEVEYAEPDFIARVFVVPIEDPTYYAIQKNDTHNVIKTEAAWDICTGDYSVLVGIIDTGISKNHEDLADNISPLVGYDYYNSDPDPDDDNNYSLELNFLGEPTTVNAFGHGTQVAGAIAAVGNNGIGISGVSWKTTMISAKVFNAAGTEARYSDIATAIIDAADIGVKVINMSFGGTMFSQTLKNACDYAYNEKDVVLIAAMGNSGDNSVFYPAGFDSVIGVGSINSNTLKRSYFSTYGAGNQRTELVAPGQDVISTCAFTHGFLGGASTHGKYHINSGTSFSAPKVSGVAALIRARYPTLKNTQVRDILRYSAIDIGDPGYDTYYGYGILNATNAINRASGYVPQKSITNIMNFPNPVTNGKTKFSFQSQKSIQAAELIIYDLRGREVARLTSGGSIMLNGGTYKTGEWDCTDSNGNPLPNGSYVYMIKATDVNGGIQKARGKLAIVR